MKRVLLSLIKAYQLSLSPFFGQQCRFSPTCSQYTAEAIAKHGPWLGSWYGLKRLSRCHPWHAGGHDPIP